jgi:hypothetical protein
MQFFHPQQCILSVGATFAGDEPVCRSNNLGDWQAKVTPPMSVGIASRQSAHITKDLEQTQITLAPSDRAPRAHPDYYNAFGARWQYCRWI